MLEATYGARFEMAGVKFYPQAGLEYRSRASVQHLYGVTAAEAAANQTAGGSLTAYQASASTPRWSIFCDVASDTFCWRPTDMPRNTSS